jgi:hypothetical protein
MLPVPLQYNNNDNRPYSEKRQPTPTPTAKNEVGFRLLASSTSTTPLPVGYKVLHMFAHWPYRLGSSRFHGGEYEEPSGVLCRAVS